MGVRGIKDKNAQASLTIEAVLVIPVVLLTIVSIIYISFYLHDYNRMQGITDRVLQKLILNIKHESDFETGKVHYEKIKDKEVFYQFRSISDNKTKEIENYLINKLSELLFATKITDVEVDVSRLRTSIKVEGEFQSPVKGLLQVFYSKRNLIVKVSSSNHNPAESVRISEVILDTGSKIKGSEELKGKIKSLIP